MAQTLRVVHYLNQFFAGVGGEEKAGLAVESREGPVGPGRRLQQLLGSEGTVVATMVAGDNYFVENVEAATAAVRAALASVRADVVVAGPAFDNGRYGVACAHVCHAAAEAGIPAVTAMFPENPGRTLFRNETLIVPTGTAATDMSAVLKDLARLAVKLGRGEELGPAAEEGYLPRGIRKEGLRPLPAHARAIQMLTARVKGEPFTTELYLDIPERIPPPRPIVEMSAATLAIATSGGIVPKGNPARQRGGESTQLFRYSIAGMDTLSPEDWECIHVGFNTEYTNANPNYAAPVSILRQFEKERVIGRLHPEVFSTSGRGTRMNDSKRIGEEVGRALVEAKVDGCILVAT